MGDIINATADLFGFGPASKAADATMGAAQLGANAQLQAAQIAADRAKFRPYNVRTALGGVRFGDQTVDVDYNPELAAYRDALLAMSRSALPQDIQQAEAAEYAALRTAADPTRSRELSQLSSGLFRTGRQGLDLYGANPELRAFNAAQIDKEIQLREQARANVASRIAQSTGLFEAGLGVENAALSPLEIGAQLGGRSASAGAIQAQALLRGGMGAAEMLSAGARQAGLMAAQQQQSLFGSLPTYRDFIRQQQAPAPITTATPTIYNNAPIYSSGQPSWYYDEPGQYSPF